MRWLMMLVLLFISSVCFATDKALLIDSNGNELGTVGNPLYITGAGSSSYTSITQDGNGNIGINSTTPIRKLDVKSTTAPAYIFDSPTGSNLTYPIGIADVGIGLIGQINDTGSSSGVGGAHGIGSFGFASDNTLTSLPLYGSEGRSNSISLTASASPIGTAGRAQWTDPNSDNSGTFLGTVTGGTFQASAYAYDGSTPRQQGYVYGGHFLTNYGGIINSGFVVDSQTSGLFNFGGIIGASTDGALWLSNGANTTDVSGGMVFGASRDTNLYRSASGTLKTDGNFVSAGTLSGTGFSTTGSGAGLMASSGGFSFDPANSTYTSGSVFMDSVGNIGIGSAIPEARLKIVGSGTGSAHALDVVDSAKASKFVVTDQGYVGIGTSNPASSLCVGSSCQFSVSGSGGATAGNGVTSASLTGSATSTTVTLTIKQTSANAISGGIQFQTGNNGAIKPMTILTGGNIGIMTTSPADSLEIDGNIYVRGTGFKYKAQSPDGTWWQCQPANTTGVFTCS